MCCATITTKFQRLPYTIRPNLYCIHLQPDLVSLTFNGEVEIHVDILEELSLIELHSLYLEVHKVTIITAEHDHHEVEFVVDEISNYLSLHLQHSLVPQKARIVINYSGILNDNLRGFYRSVYKDSENNSHYIATTQFESTFARYAFPCWDEPDRKARFRVQIETTPENIALSNMPETERKLLTNGKTLFSFAESPIMSTYLVAFAVGPFESIKGQSNTKININVYTLPGKSQHAHFALDVAKKSIEWYADWFEQPYTLPKCDVLAVPDFCMGAMENWGLLIFREVNVLYDSENSTPQQKIKTATTIAHEMAHMWFGNLVTMKWWNDLWLKEGFATFMEFLFVAYNFPEMEPWLEMVSIHLVQGMKLDAMRASHPIQVALENPNQLSDIFDNITYCKASSVIRMLYEHLGEKSFQKGLRIYLEKHKYGNAETKDLWNALSIATGEDIDRLMCSWTEQMGFPLVSVSSSGGGKLRLGQSRFIADGSSAEGLWKIPIQISDGRRFIFEGPEMEINGDHNTVVNSDWAGMYIVKYENYDSIIQLFPQLSILDRMQICNNIGALLRAGKIGIEVLCDLLLQSHNESSYHVWQALDAVIGLVTSTCKHEKFQKLVIDTVLAVLKYIGEEDQSSDDQQVKRLRALLHARLITCSHTETVSRLSQKFLLFVEGKETIPPHHRPAVFANAVMHAEDKKNIEELENVYATCGFSEVERQCLQSLGLTSNIDFLSSIMTFAIDEGQVRKQDLIFLFASLGASKIGQHFAWNYMKDNFDGLLVLLGGTNARHFQECYRFSTENCCDFAMAEDMEIFFKQNMDELSLSTFQYQISQVTERIRSNAAVSKRIASHLESYFLKKEQ